jgi:hypothetical protein
MSPATGPIVGYGRNSSNPDDELIVEAGDRDRDSVRGRGRERETEAGAETETEAET